MEWRGPHAVNGPWLSWNFPILQRAWELSCKIGSLTFPLLFCSAWPLRYSNGGRKTSATWGAFVLLPHSMWQCENTTMVDCKCPVTQEKWWLMGWPLPWPDDLHQEAVNYVKPPAIKSLSMFTDVARPGIGCYSLCWMLVISSLQIAAGLLISAWLFKACKCSCTLNYSPNILLNSFAQHLESCSCRIV